MNLLQNVNKRNEEERRLRAEQTESVNNKFYNKYLKRKKEEQKRLMTSARQIIFKNKDAPKLMLRWLKEAFFTSLARSFCKLVYTHFYFTQLPRFNVIRIHVSMFLYQLHHNF